MLLPWHTLKNYTLESRVVPYNYHLEVFDRKPVSGQVTEVPPGHIFARLQQGKWEGFRLNTG